MSRHAGAHALTGGGRPPADRATATRSPGARQHIENDGARYVERAKLLWPRLDRAALRRTGGDPARIAEIVVRRTAQPLEAVLAMLIRDCGPRGGAIAGAPDSASGVISLKLVSGNERVGDEDHVRALQRETA